MGEGVYLFDLEDFLLEDLMVAFTTLVVLPGLLSVALFCGLGVWLPFEAGLPGRFFLRFLAIG